MSPALIEAIGRAALLILREVGASATLAQVLARARAEGLASAEALRLVAEADDRIRAALADFEALNRPE